MRIEIKRETIFLILLLFTFFLSCARQEREAVDCDVLVLGAGTGAVAAALQAARLEATTILVNPQPWLGGMLTSAGVSATDGNHRLPAGLWGEFRDSLRRYYGGADSLFTGWVSNTMFEPHVGAQILEKMTLREKRLTVYHQATWEKIEKNGLWMVLIRLADGSEKTIKARILVDGTDLGDVAAAAGAAYDLGMEARSQTGEAAAPETANDIIQDLTYVAILKDYGAGADRTISQPEGYDPAVFQCACRYDCPDEKAHPCETMLSYGKLPRGKYMINWPIEGNDYYVNDVEMNQDARAEAYRQAKLHTLRFVYYIQQELGFRHLGLADDEFPTEDRLALMPYHREGRRIRGLARLTVNEIVNPFSAPLYRTGIAVGDYPIDHHHDKNPHAPEIDFPKVPSFSIPAGCLIPKGVDHLLVADKPISVSNIVNGSSRLQPVILQIGQAAGLMAAMAAKQNLSPGELDLRTVQNNLIQQRGYLLPYIDVTPEHPQFGAIQRIGATGILRGRGVPYQWANQTWFDPDTTLQTGIFVQNLGEFEEGLKEKLSLKNAPDEALSIDQSIRLLYTLVQFYDLNAGQYTSMDHFSDHVQKNWSGLYQLSDFDPGRSITKAEMAVLLDQLIDPFNLQKVNFSGETDSDTAPM